MDFSSLAETRSSVSMRAKEHSGRPRRHPPWLSSRCLGPQPAGPVGPLQMQQNLFRLQGWHGARRCYYAMLRRPLRHSLPRGPLGGLGFPPAAAAPRLPPWTACLPPPPPPQREAVRGNPAEATLPARLRGAGYRGGTRRRWNFQPPPCDVAPAVWGGTCNKRMHGRHLRLIVRERESRRGRANLRRFCLHMCAAPLCAGTNGAAGRFAVKLCQAPFSSLSSLPPVAEGTQ